MAEFHAAVTARILESRPDGSGIVEVPILRVGQAPFEDGDWVVTADTLRELVDNFQRGRGLIVGVGPSPHKKFGERSGPQAAFVRSLRIDGDVLMAVHDIAIPRLFRQVSGKSLRDEDGGKFVGYSVETIRHDGMPDQLQAQYKFDGWVLVGGVFTNRPVFDTVFQIAAETVSIKRFNSEFRPPADKESVMSDLDMSVKLATAEASVESKQKQIDTLSASIVTRDADLKSRDERIAQLQCDLDAARATESTAKQSRDRIAADLDEERRKSATLETTLADERKRRVKLETESVALEVRRIYRAAVARGVAPATFPGFAEAEQKGTIYEVFNNTYRSLEAFKLAAESAPATTSMSSLRTRETTQDDTEPVMDEERKENLKRLGLNPNLAVITTEAEMRRVLESAKK